MVVPHCGSKTINVRLTVSPESKSKPADPERKITRKTRLKSRRLFKYDDEEEGSGNGCLEPNHDVEKTPSKQFIDDTTQHQTKITTINRQSNDYHEKLTGINNENHQLDSNQVISKDTIDGQITLCCTNESGKGQRHAQTNQTTENLYETALTTIVPNENLISTAKSMCGKDTPNNDNACCQDCRTSTPNCTEGVYTSRPCVRRLGRKSRSRKTKTLDYYPPTRTRSLSVGNENSYRNSNGDVSSGASGKGRNDECLNNLRRNDLIDIIRESMEKSRLCFQSNG